MRLKTLSKVDHVVFDKTGTLTLGQMQLIEQKHFPDPTLADSDGQRAGTALQPPDCKIADVRPVSATCLLKPSVAGLAQVWKDICMEQTIRLGHQQFVAGLTGTCAPMTEPARGSAIWLGSRSALAGLLCGR